MSYVQVHRIFPSGVAAQEGSIQEGDTILSINGTSLCSCAHWEALRVLRRARTRNLGVVVLRRGEVSNVSKIGTETSSSTPKQTQVTEIGQRQIYPCLDSKVCQNGENKCDCVFLQTRLLQVSVFVCVWRKKAEIWASA